MEGKNFEIKNPVKVLTKIINKYGGIMSYTKSVLNNSHYPWKIKIRFPVATKHLYINLYLALLISMLYLSVDCEMMEYLKKRFKFICFLDS